jgi:hypothetical protein
VKFLGSSWLLLLLLVAAPARAASIEVTVKDTGLAQVVAKGFAPGTVCAPAKETADGVAACRSTCATSIAAGVAACADAACKESARALAPACVSSCPVPDSSRAFSPTSADFTVATSAPLLDKSEENGELARALLVSGSAWCVSAERAPEEAKVTLKPVALPLTTTLGAWRSLDDSSRLTWFGWDVPAFNAVIDKLGPLTCEIQPATTPHKNTCQLVRERGRNGGPKLTFIAERPVAKDSTILVKTGAKTAITLPLTDCSYTPTGALTILYADSEEQRLELASSPSCLGQLALFDTVTLALGSATIEATVEKDAGTGRIRYLATHRVPADLALGTQELELRFGRALLGTLRVGVRTHGLKVSEDASHAADLSVSYGVEELDAWQSGQSTAGFAVTTPNVTDEPVFITNRAKLENVDPGLRELGQRLSGMRRDETMCRDYWRTHGCDWRGADGAKLNPNDPYPFCAAVPIFKCDGQPSVCDGVSLEWKVDYCFEEIKVGADPFTLDEDARLDSYRARARAWRVRSASWGEQVWFNETWLRRNDARQAGIEAIEFAVFSERRDPLRVEIELRDDAKDVVLFRANVLLANGARRESLPLPLADALKVECGQKEPKRAQDRRQRFRDTLLNGQVRAVQDEDLDSGLCQLHYDHSRMLHLLEEAIMSRAGKAPEAESTEKRNQRLERVREIAGGRLRFYGRQLVEVVVQRGTEPSVTLSWSLDPTQEQTLKLPGVKPRAGDYVISAHIKGPRPPDVVYRQPVTQSGATMASVNAALADLEFSATLRPRGLGGWAGANVRTFVTFPVRFTGLRFPAKASELTGSGDATAVQVAGVRAGVMGVVEPWNYHTRRNSWPIPVRFMSGMNLYDLASGNFAPAFLAGASISLPVMPLDGSPTARNVESTVSVGAFWEVDLERPAPLRDGHHLLVTLGLDLLSLFSE